MILASFVHMAFPSSSSDKIYEVTDGEDGLVCTCPAWKFNHGGKRQCKHVVQAASELGIDLSKQSKKVSKPKKVKAKKNKVTSYKGKNFDLTLKVGQIWVDTANGEPDIKIIKIGKNLSSKGINSFGSCHDYLCSDVKVIEETDGELGHWDAENLLDNLECNCYELKGDK